MSKVFEQAYKELAQTDVPDLWDRIEAGLNEKSAPAALNIDEAEEAVQKETIKEVSKKRHDTKKNNKVLVFMRKYSAVAAAAVCVAILIPAISLIGRFGIGGSKSEAAVEVAMEAPAAQAPAEMYEEAVAEEAPAETIEEYVYAQAATTEECEYEEAAVAEGAAKESVLNDMAADVKMEDMMETVREESAEEKKASASGKGQLLAERCPEGTVVRDVQVKVTKVSEHAEFFEGTDREELGYICNAEVQKHSDGLLTEGEQIDIFISGYSSIALIKDGVFKLDLESFVSEEECYFEIKQYHMQLEP